MARIPASRPMWLAGVACVAAIVPATVVPAFLSQRDKAVAKFADWRVEGPPCPVGEPLAAMPKTMVLEHVGFARRHGHSACTVLHDDEGRGFATFPICQFTSPGLVRVTTRETTFWFAPPPGRPATVSVRGGRAECRVAFNPDRFNPKLDKPWS